VHAVLFRLFAGGPQTHAYGRTRREGCLRPYQECAGPSPHHGHPTRHVHPSRSPVLSRERARQAAIVAHGGKEGLARYIESGTSQAKIAYDRQVAARNSTREAFDSQGRINNTVDDITRFMTMVPIPYFDPSSRKMHVGLACQGCKFAIDRMSGQTLSSSQYHNLVDRRDRTYTEEEILQHFEGCLDARALWSAHQNFHTPAFASGQ
jgi:hypothetical protein